MLVSEMVALRWALAWWTGSLMQQQNDDFAMGAPPGAPSAMGEVPTPRFWT